MVFKKYVILFIATLIQVILYWFFMKLDVMKILVQFLHLGIFIFLFYFK